MRKHLQGVEAMIMADDMKAFDDGLAAALIERDGKLPDPAPLGVGQYTFNTLELMVIKDALELFVETTADEDDLHDHHIAARLWDELGGASY